MYGPGRNHHAQSYMHSTDSYSEGLALCYTAAAFVMPRNHLLDVLSPYHLYALFVELSVELAFFLSR